MTHVPLLALSISTEVKSVGAYAGFAAVVGLAILSLLYFAQARELRRLREWAGRAPERVTAPEPQTIAAQRRVVARPVPPQSADIPKPQPQQPASAPTPAAPAAAAAAAASAAVAAPAATPKPVVVAEPAPDAPAKPPAPAPAKPPAPAPATPAATPAATPTPVPAAIAAAKPVTAAAAQGASAVPTAAPQPPRPPAPAPVTAPRVPPPPPRPAAAAATAGAAGAVRAQPLRRSDAAAVRAPKERKQGGSRLPRQTLVWLGVAIATVLVVVLLAAKLFGGGSATPQPNQVAPPSAPAHATSAPSQPSRSIATPAVNPSSVTVAVLNGTETSGLARSVASSLASHGYVQGVITDAPSQSHTSTSVLYAPGSEAAAQAVARVLGVGSSAVSPLDQATAAVVGSQAQVVVIAGPNAATQ